jgi:hypothetical protein
MANKPISTPRFAAWGSFVSKFSIVEGLYSVVDMIVNIKVELPVEAKISLAVLACAGFAVGFVDMGVRIAEERDNGGFRNGWRIRNSMGKLCLVLGYGLPVASFIGFVVYLAVPSFLTHGAILASFFLLGFCGILAGVMDRYMMSKHRQFEAGRIATPPVRV